MTTVEDVEQNEAVRRYLFGMRVADATAEEHDNALGLNQVRVVCADYETERIYVRTFEYATLARMWVAVEEQESSEVFHIVGDDV